MQFHISLTSLAQIKTFVALAARQPFKVFVGNERQQINGKDIIGMVTLDHSRPLLVRADCSADEFAAFQTDVQAL